MLMAAAAVCAPGRPSALGLRVKWRGRYGELVIRSLMVTVWPSRRVTLLRMVT